MRDFLSRHLFSPLQGMTAGAWATTLRQNRLAVGPPYWPRAAFQSAVVPFNSAIARLENAVHGRAVEATRVEPPLFILGHWRQGTTHLHNLLARDPQFAYPTLYQTLYPRTFLTTEGLVPRLGRPLLMRQRPHDHVALDFGVPNEDEIALVNDSGRSPYLAWAFPRHAASYDRFLTLREATGDEVAAWKASLLRFLKKLTLRHGRPLVLKSPPHTARIRLLLGLFPDARFVHIRRDPYEVFRSTRHMVATTMRYWRLQEAPPGGEDEEGRILRIYREMYDAYFEQRGLIPAGNLCEVAYEDLERDPIGQVGAIYDALGLPGFEAARPRLEVYLGSIAGYLKNSHLGLPEPLRRRIARDWERNFEAWGYPR
ncbi:sulfotransferase family protein [Tautonia plasticadhaerens]|uniref:Sulfotransferase domain protein n=1 Tax=Tautonia plasticadhaerens TaxID=2527974 RepID=A0A518H9K6_9BACT|nr:sulfotransferase [Tautonia plasticadhaerens]QDV37530.1 hypothetical protein ElP_54700 [Tautonia plasticadhaerens]